MMIVTIVIATMMMTMTMMMMTMTIMLLTDQHHQTAGTADPPVVPT